MSAIYVNVSKTLLRPYCLLDAEIFTPDQWDRIAERFQQAVKEKRYTKLLYDTWRELEHNKNYAYRVVSFICNNTDYNANRVSIKTFNFDPNDPYVFVDDRREYVFLTSDDSLGEYLKDVYFNCNFKLAEVDTTDLPDVNSWEYMGSKFGIYPPPKDKLTDLAWCALYYKHPWVFKLTEREVSYGKAIASMERKMIIGGIEKPDWTKQKAYNELNKTVSNVINDVLPKTWEEKIRELADKPNMSILDKDKSFINESLAYGEDNQAYYKVNSYGTIDTTSIKCDTSTATESLTGTVATATSTSINWTPLDSVTTVNISSTKQQVDDLTKRVENIENTINKKKKKEDNKMKMFNFDFGPIKDNDAIRMSPYGLAVKNVNGTYQAYDKKNGEIMDVDIFNFKADNMFFKMPVGIDAIEAGDVIIFNRRPCFVFGFSEQGDVIAIDIAMGEKKTIMPTRSPFGFNFITKVVSLADGMFGNTPSAENPFGNMWMFAMMDDKSSMKDMLPMMMLMNGNAGGTMDPMMLYFMMKDSKDDNDSMLPFLLMMNKK